MDPKLTARSAKPTRHQSRKNNRCGEEAPAATLYGLLPRLGMLQSFLVVPFWPSSLLAVPVADFLVKAAVLALMKLLVRF